MRIRRRTFGDVVRAFFAFIALVVLLVGVPGALAYFVGWPLPHEAPSSDMLTEDVTADVFIKVFAVVVWLAWAQFSACVLVEAKAAMSGVGMPGRVPGAGASQALARQLVAAVLLLTAGAASFAPGLSQLGQQLEQNRQPPVATAQQLPGQQGGQHAAGARPAVDVEDPRGGGAGGEIGKGPQEQAERDTKYYRIQPPEGRHHDSLWEIAERHLDDGRRYKEIYQLNKDRIQPDGSRLSQASLIRPGWIMEMPADAHGGDLVEMPDEQAELSKGEAEQIDDYDKSSPTAGERGQQGAGDDRFATSGRGERLVPETPAVDRDGATEAGEEAPAQQVPAKEGAGQAQGADGGVGGGETAGPLGSIGLPEALVGAPLLAAGLLAALGRRRRQALWQAAFNRGGAGRAGVEPTGPAALARDALLVGADPEGVRFLDRALRGLSASLMESARPLPTIYAAWFTEGDLYLQLAGVAGEPPAPWRTGQDQTFWRIERADVESYDIGEGDAAVAAPYPGLASLGTREGARLLLNLEAVPGIAAVKGAQADRLAVLSSIAAELATNGWSDRMTVTLVGFGERLTELAPTRIRYIEDVAALVETMEAETGQRASALGNAGHDSVLTGRAGLAGHTQWAPHLVLVATEPTAAEADRLAQLASGSSRLGIGYLVGTAQEELQGASWEFEITRDGRLRAPLLGLELEAQQLPQRQHDSLVELFSGIDADGPARGDGTDGRGLRVPAAANDPGFTVDLSEQGRPAVYARLMGSYEIIGLHEPDGERSPLLREALALLLLHREGVHPQVLEAALWPRGVTADVRDAFIERLVTWLGHDPTGAPRLAPDGDGRLTLSASVVSDWDVLRTLHHEATDPDREVRPAVRERLLADALALAAGPLLSDRPGGRYGWLANEIVEAQLPLLVADAGLALSALRREADKADAAVTAVQSALVVAPADERLWNELLRAVHGTGDTARLEATASDLLDRAAALHGARGLPPRTEALLDELLPGWRGQSAAAT